ncbi:MAG: cytochrome c3 family protein [Gemmatimonadota bacterium]
MAGVGFRHLDHPGLEAGADASCGTCHTHPDGTSDLDVRTDACVLCHAEPQPTGPQRFVLEPDGCQECHAEPTHVAFASTGTPIDHATVLENDIPCLQCHYDVTAGSGGLAEDACRSCHGPPGAAVRLTGGEPRDASTVHDQHAVDGGPACTRCHEEISHSVVGVASALELECTACHVEGDPALRQPVDSTAHVEDQLVFAGLSPFHEGALPAVKFRARISCQDCHSAAAMQAAPDSPARLSALRQECVACHGSRFAGLLDEWVEGMRANTRSVGAYVAGLHGDPRIDASPDADSLRSVADSLWTLISAGHGVHNIGGADRMLRDALADAAEASRRAGLVPAPLPDLGPVADAASCARCHYRPGRSHERFPEPFDHRAHGGAEGLECADCHTPASLFVAEDRVFDPDHGGITLAAGDCLSCHHAEPELACASCHVEGDAFQDPHTTLLPVTIERDRQTRPRPVDFSHLAHDAVDCTRCHTGAPPALAPADCASCHEEHHDVEVSGCTSCHGATVKEAHTVADHLDCGACHTNATLADLGAADRRFCLQCHAEQVDHKPEGECASCHLLLEPAAAMRRILAAEEAPPR